MSVDKLFRFEERAVFMLRSLYSGFGYTPFKMSKFEEYDLYVRNKDFLISDGIITFTDTNGKLMALKPDVTLSIIKNSVDSDGKVDKFYYDESVYRISGSSSSFKEITQTGLECIGDIGMYEICEVLTLAVKSLGMISGEYILDLSHAGLYAAVLDTLALDSATRAEVASAIRIKSADALRTALSGDSAAIETASKLLCSYADTDSLRSAFSDIDSEAVKSSLYEICAAADTLTELSLGARINFDFSIVNDVRYYSGVVFKGYIKGIPTEVLSGGQYDKLMRKLGRNSGAIGFAVYLDVLERMDSADEYDFDYALIAGDASPAELIRAVENLSADGSTVAVYKALPDGIRCRKVIKAEEM